MSVHFSDIEMDGLVSILSALACNRSMEIFYIDSLCRSEAATDLVSLAMQSNPHMACVIDRSVLVQRSVAASNSSKRCQTTIVFTVVVHVGCVSEERLCVVLLRMSGKEEVRFDLASNATVGDFAADI